MLLPPPPPDRPASRSALRQIARGSRRYTIPWLSVGRWRKRVLLVGAALLAGLVAILFAVGAEFAIAAHARMIRLSPWLTLLIAPAGFAAMAWIAARFFPATQGSGIPQSIAASQSSDPRVRGHLLSLRLACAKVALTLGGLLAGASIGREGPSVQIGASVMHSLAGRRFGRTPAALGWPSGIWPVLMCGALGAVLADVTSGQQDAALMVLGMVAFLSAMTRTPITAFVIVMEMTANHEMLLPLMATSVIAHGFSKSVSPLALYHALAAPALRRAQLQAGRHRPQPTRAPEADAAPPVVEGGRCSDEDAGLSRRSSPASAG